MKRFAVLSMAVILAAFAVNSSSPAHGAQQSKERPAAEVRPSSAGAEAQEPAQTQVPIGQDTPFRRGDTAPEIKPYDRVITRDAKSDAGVFTVHRIKEKVYYEIPKDELGKDFLWVSHLRGELRSLNQMIGRAMLHATDRATRLHLEDSKDQIAKTLDPKFAQPAPTVGIQAQQGGRRGLDDSLEEFDPSDPNAPLGCWPDYAVKRPRD